VTKEDPDSVQRQPYFSATFFFPESPFVYQVAGILSSHSPALHPNSFELITCASLPRAGFDTRVNRMLAFTQSVSPAAPCTSVVVRRVPNDADLCCVVVVPCFLPRVVYSRTYPW